MLHRLTLPQLLAVRRALQAGLRHVEIAREFQLGVWTVDRIAALERYATESPTEADLLDDDAPPDYVPANLRRCPSCGAMVYVWPCLGCRLAVTTPQNHQPESSRHVASAASTQRLVRAPTSRRTRIRPPSVAERSSQGLLSGRHRVP